MDKIQMVDLIGQYEKIESQIKRGLINVIEKAAFINGPEVKNFEAGLANYLGANHVIACGNGTDALQIALMALDLYPGDEVIVQDFTYVASMEVIALLGLKPVMVDVDLDSFNINVSIIEAHITPKTKAIIPVHLFGQSCDMAPIMELEKKHNLYVIEDNAQSVSTDYTFPDGTIQKTGTIGHIGTTSFYPSKNLGGYGDGGALTVNDDELALKIRKIANHGQSERYYHDTIGVNSRLDSMQAVVLNAKLPLLDTYNARRSQAARAYDVAFNGLVDLVVPQRMSYSSHVFHQYTLRVLNGKRDELQRYLSENGIPSMIYYPVPLHQQKAYSKFLKEGTDLKNTLQLVDEVISLPMHTELTDEQLDFICEKVKGFFS